MKAATPGAATPPAVHYVTSGAGSDVRDDVTSPGDSLGALKFAHGGTPGFVVLRANRTSLAVTHHSAPAGTLLHTEVIPRVVGRR